MSTCNVTVTNLTHYPKVALSFDVEEKDVPAITAICRHHFPSVEIVDNETGEVIFTYYNSRQWFYPSCVSNFVNNMDRYIIKPEVQ